MSEKTPKCIDCGSSPDFVVRLVSGRWKCMDCRTEWGENWDWNDDPRTKGLQTNLVRLTSERDEAVRVAGELRAALQRCHDVLDDTNAAAGVDGPMCVWCNETGYDGDGLKHAADCVLVEARHSLTASTGGSSDEPQKEIRE